MPRLRRAAFILVVLNGLPGFGTLRQRLWIWMGLGLGFGNDDLAQARPIHFDKDSYDMSRGRTGFQRYGEMRPMV